MLILTNENKSFDLTQIGTHTRELKESIFFSVFDFSNKAEYDYYFKPLIMIETFNDAILEFQIGPHKLTLPKEWSIILGDPETGDIELIPIEEINTRTFHAFTMNPIKTTLHKFLPLKITDVFSDVSCTVPRLAFHNFLVSPLTSGPNPDCIFLINERDQKKLPILELGMLI